jgi:hypothetical protein
MDNTTSGLRAPSPASSFAIGITPNNWHDLVTVVLTTYTDAYGAIEAQRRLKPHLAFWPQLALDALASISQIGGAK